MKHTIFKLFAGIVTSGVLLGLSQPMVVETLSAKPLDSTGLSGLLALGAFIPLLMLLRGASAKKAFVLSYLTCLIQYSIIFYWIYIPLHVFGHVSPAFSSFVVFLLAAILSLFSASAFGIAYSIMNAFSWSNWVVLPAALSASTYVLNFWFFGGFPWGNVGYSLASVPLLLQQMSLWGIYGALFFVMFVNTTLFTMVNAALSKKNFQTKKIIFCVFLVLSVLSYGIYQVHFNPIQGETIRVALLQGNIEQGIKNQLGLYGEEIFLKFKQLQDQAVEQGAQLIIWPEASWPGSISSKKTRFDEIGSNIPPSVIGAMVKEEGRKFYNAALVIDKQQNIIGRVNKSHLVPFGEYVPWPFQPIVSKVVPGLGSFMVGGDMRGIDIAITPTLTVKAGMTICYEGVFPEVSRAFARNGADILINQTNDAWYGISSAPYQHLTMYVVRAVETGRPYMRATNTGVSAFVDRKGVISHPSELYETQVVMGDVILDHENTLYLLIGDLVPLLSIIFVLLFFLLSLVGIKNVLRAKSLSQIAAIGVSIALMVFSSAYYLSKEQQTDEASMTKLFIVFTLGYFLLAKGLRGKTKKL